jgi:hypothetical protein
MVKIILFLVFGVGSWPLLPIGCRNVYASIYLIIDHCFGHQQQVNQLLH